MMMFLPKPCWLACSSFLYAFLSWCRAFFLSSVKWVSVSEIVRPKSVAPPGTNTRFGHLAKAFLLFCMVDDAADGQDGIKVASAGSLILLQVFSRFLTLFMTQMQIRLTSAEVLGAATIHFELLLSTILTFSREGFRTSLSRRQIDTSSTTTTSTTAKAAKSSYDGKKRVEGASTVRNVAILPVPIGIAISVLVMTVYARYLAPRQLTAHPDFSRATQGYLLGAILELLAEPLYIASLMELDTTTRVQAEGLAIAAKSAATLYSLWVMKDTTTLLPFGIGQIAFGGSFLLVYLLSFARSKGLSSVSTFYVPEAASALPVGGGKEPKKREKEDADIVLGLYDKDSLHLAWTMTRQNMVKHALGEGDKFAIARLASLSDQGAYALASNYGSLVARIIYQPLEESSRLTFARALGDEKKKPTEESIAVTTNILHTLTSFYVLLSLFLLAFCPAYSTMLLLFLAGRRWALETSAPVILAFYGTLYLPAMAFNGLLEGFLQACASPPRLSKYSFVLAGASLVFVTSLAALHQSSIVSAEKSLILATTLSTISRAAYCYRFTLSFMQDKKKQLPKSRAPSKSRSLLVSSFLPSYVTLTTFVLSALATNWHPVWLHTGPLDYAHLLTGISCLTVCVSVCILYERATILGTLDIIRGRQG